MAQTELRSIVELSDMVLDGWNIKYAEAIRGASSQFNMLAQTQRTNTEKVNIPFRNTWDQLKSMELHEDMPYETKTAEFITRAIARYGKGVQISKFEWEEPHAQSVLMNAIDALVAETSYRKARAIANVLENGDTGSILAYDGLNVFATNHTLNNTTFSNLITGQNLDAAGFQVAKARLRRIPLGADGSFLPMEAAKFFLVVPPELEEDARLLLNSDTIARENITARNPWQGAAEPIISELLTDTNDWYLIATTPGLSPFVTVEHTTSSPTLKAYIAETDRNVSENNLYQWNLQILEETYVVHYYQMVKVTNS